MSDNATRQQKSQSQSTHTKPDKVTPSQSVAPIPLNHMSGNSLSHEQITRLQRHIGNQGVQEMIGHTQPLQRQTKTADPTDATTEELNSDESFKTGHNIILPQEDLADMPEIKAEADGYVAVLQSAVSSWQAWRSSMLEDPQYFAMETHEATQTFKKRIADTGQQKRIQNYVRRQLGATNLYYLREIASFFKTFMWENAMGEFLGLEFVHPMHTYWLELAESDDEMSDDVRNEIINRVLGHYRERLRNQLKEKLGEEMTQLLGDTVDEIADKTIEKALSSMEEQTGVSIEDLAFFRRAYIYYKNDFGMSYMREIAMGGLAKGLGTAEPLDEAISDTAFSFKFWLPSEFDGFATGFRMGGSVGVLDQNISMPLASTVTYRSGGAALTFEFSNEELLSYEPREIDYEGLAEGVVEEVLNSETKGKAKLKAIITSVLEAVFDNDAGFGGSISYNIGLGDAEIDSLEPPEVVLERLRGTVLDRSVYFKTGESELDDAALAVIQNLVYETRQAYVDANARNVPGLTIAMDVTGHASPRWRTPEKEMTASELNKQLSEDRASNTAAHLQAEFGTIDELQVTVNQSSMAGEEGVLDLPVADPDAKGEGSADYEQQYREDMAELLNDSTDNDVKPAEVELGDTYASQNHAESRRADIKIEWSAVQDPAEPQAIPERTEDNLPDFMSDADEEFIEAFLNKYTLK